MELMSVHREQSSPCKKYKHVLDDYQYISQLVHKNARMVKETDILLPEISFARLSSWYVNSYYSFI